MDTEGAFHLKECSHISLLQKFVASPQYLTGCHKTDLFGYQFDQLETLWLNHQTSLSPELYLLGIGFTGYTLVI